MELPNAVSYIVFVGIIVAVGSVAAAWGPLAGVTSFAVADQGVSTCSQEQCDFYDVLLCQDRALVRVDYDCIEGKCRLIKREVITNCNFACTEPQEGDAHCELRGPR